MEKLDLIYSMMTMHHILDINSVFKAFYSMLKPGGYLCIVDVVEEDGSFHGEGFTGYNGFNREELTGRLKALGFSHVDYQVCFEIIREATGKGQDRFPLFSLVVQRQDTKSQLSP